ncbi:hypothetical protein FISHEDRAFT_78329 [Fistulina hepatica ATCC 64428]|nr:hypothetical protein FISHEDRAFT_78329 [Fistulina hepatica ATCC 64428]
MQVVLSRHETWFSFLAALVAALATGWRHSHQPHPYLAAGTSAVNTGFTALCFFSLREFAVTPFISPPAGAGPGSYGDMRKQKLLDSLVSGAIVGSALRGYRSGLKAVVPGAFVLGSLCTALQLGANELSVMRIKLVHRLAASSSNTSTVPSKPILASRPDEAEITRTRRSVKERLLALVGVRPLTDEEMLDHLKRTRDKHLARIAELERELEQHGTDPPPKA